MLTNITSEPLAPVKSTAKPEAALGDFVVSVSYQLVLVSFFLLKHFLAAGKPIVYKYSSGIGDRESGSLSFKIGF